MGKLSQQQYCGGWLYRKGNWGRLLIILSWKGEINGWTWSVSRQALELLGSTDMQNKNYKERDYRKNTKLSFISTPINKHMILNNLLDFRLSDISRKSAPYWSCEIQAVWVHLWMSAQLHARFWGITEQRLGNFFSNQFPHRENIPLGHQVLIYSVNTMAVRFTTMSLITLIDKELPQNSFNSRQTWSTNKSIQLEVYSQTRVFGAGVGRERGRSTWKTTPDFFFPSMTTIWGWLIFVLNSCLLVSLVAEGSFDLLED